jgi:hypothetical protein
MSWPWPPEGDTYTAFTGEFLKPLRDGDPDGPPQMTLQSIYRYLVRVLPARGGPRHVGAFALSASSAANSSASAGSRQPSLSHSQDDTETHARRETKAWARPPRP